MTLNLALVISGDARGAKQASGEAATAIRGVGTDAQQTAAIVKAANDQNIAMIRRVTEALNGEAAARQRVQAIVNSYAGIRLPTDDAGYRQRAADIAVYGQELDQLRAKFNPLFAASKAYEDELTAIDRAHRVGAITAREQEAAIASLNDRYTAQQKIASAGLDGVGRSANLTSNQLLNLSRQGNDVITMFALGADPLTIFASQIGQVYDALESGPRGLKGSLQGLLQLTKQVGVGLVGFLGSPMGLVASGTVAAVAGLAGYYYATRQNVRELNEILKDHEEIIKKIGDAYGIVESKAKGAFSFDTGTSLRLSSAATLNELRLSLANQMQGTMSELLVNRGGGASGNQFGPAQVIAPEFAAFSDAIEHLRTTAAKGAPDILGFKKMVEDRWALDPNNAALTETAVKLQALFKDATTTASALKELEAIRSKMAAAVGPGGLPLRGGSLSTEDMGSYSQFLASERVAAQRARQAAEAQRLGIFARSPSELSGAARAQAAAQYNDNETPEARALRIELAGTLALTQATHALTEAQRQRALALNETISSAQLDVDLVGKSAAEAARLRMEHQLTAQVRAAAAEAGVKADEDEIALIREKAAEYGKLVALQSARDALRSQGEELERLRLEASLIGASAGVRARAIALMEVEQQIRREGYDTMGREAQMLREGAIAIADHTEALKRQADAWGIVQRAGESAIDSLLEGDWKSAANDIIKSAIDLNIGNPLKNWAFGSGLPTGADLNGIWGKMFGGADQDAGSLVSSILGGGKDVGAMTVNAGTVMITGSIGVGGGIGGLASNVSRMFGGANGNAGSGDGSVMSRIWSFFSGKGLADHQVAGIMGNIGAESTFNPSAINPKSGAFGLFQHLGSRLTGLGTGAGLEQQLNYAWKELQSSESGVLARLLGSKDVRSATSAFAGFERAEGWTRANPEGIALWDQRLQGAQASLEKFGNTTVAANQNLGQFGNGLGQFGNALSQFPAAPGGGGAGSVLSSLFGGLNNAFSGSKAFSWLTANPGGFIGLYDRGGWTGPGGKFDPAGIVHRDEYVFSSEATRAIGVSNLDRLHSAAKTGFASGGYGGGGSGPARSNWSMTDGRVVVEVRLGEGLIAEILSKAGNQSVEIVQANDKYRRDYYQSGGEAA